MPEVHTGCHYHTQDLSDSCGAAVAMMILDTFGQPAGGFDQKVAMAALAGHGGPGVATRPVDLVNFLNGKTSAGSFGLRRPKSIADLTALVASVLKNHAGPLAVPVYDSAHWIVVEGGTFDSQGEPLGFWVNDPQHWGLLLPPPHKLDVCGTGGAHGVKDDFRTLKEWSTIVSQPSADFRFACVIPAGIGLPPSPQGIAPEPPAWHLSPNSALNAEELNYYQLLRRGPIFELEIGEPIEVKRLDSRDDSYRLVPLGNKGRLDIVAIAVSAVNGSLQSVGFPSRPLARLRPSDSEIVGLLMDIVSLGDFAPDPAWWRGKLSNARYVWKPCPESFSPYSPFIEIQAVEPRPVVFISFDLRVYFELSKPVEGG